jgi:hypothetical protein
MFQTSAGLTQSNASHAHTRLHTLISHPPFLPHTPIHPPSVHLLLTPRTLCSQTPNYRKVVINRLTGLTHPPSVHLLSTLCSQIPNYRKVVINRLPGLTHPPSVHLLSTLCSQIPNYRKVAINSLPGLTYLDDRPVFPKDRAMAEAFCRGGRDAEREARDEFVRKDRERMMSGIRHLEAIAARREEREAAAAAAGGIVNEIDDDQDQDEDDLPEDQKGAAKGAHAKGPPGATAFEEPWLEDTVSSHHGERFVNYTSATNNPRSAFGSSDAASSKVTVGIDIFLAHLLVSEPVYVVAPPCLKKCLKHILSF